MKQPLAVIGLAVALAPALPAVAAEPLDIPVVLSLSGQGAFLAKQEHDALALLEKSVNAAGGIKGRTLRLAFQDDQSNPQTAVQLASDVIAQKPSLLLGSSLVATCNAMAPLVTSGPLTYCFSAGIHPAAGSYVFTAGTSTFDQARVMVRFFRLRGWTRIALATSTDATGQDADRGFAQVLADPENKDVKLAAHVHFNTNDVSVSAQMEEVRAAKPQAFILWATGSPAGIVFRGLTQAGIELPVGTTGGNLTYAQMRQFAAFLPKELYIPSSEWLANGDPRVVRDPAVAEKQKELFAAFAAAGAKPDEGSILAWDPATILIDGLKALGDGATAQQLHDWLVHLQKQPGASGLYDYVASPQRGLTIDDIVMTRWDATADRWNVVSQTAGAPLE